MLHEDYQIHGYDVKEYQEYYITQNYLIKDINLNDLFSCFVILWLLILLTIIIHKIRRV
jgi:hypothetical protein